MRDRRIEEREEAYTKAIREARQADMGRAYRAVAAKAEGRMVLRSIINAGNIFATGYQPNAMAAFEAGKSAMAKEIWNNLSRYADRDDFMAICIGEENGKS